MTTNTLVRDLNVAVSRFDDRRIEVIANGLPLWNGAQIAVDTTIVSPLTAAGEPSRRDALLEARRRKEAIPSFLPTRAVIGVEVGGRWGSEAASFRVPEPEPRRRPFALPFEVLMSTAGLACCALQLRSPSLTASLPCPPLA